MPLDPPEKAGSVSWSGETLVSVEVSGTNFEFHHLAGCMNNCWSEFTTTERLIQALVDKEDLGADREAGEVDNYVGPPSRPMRS